MKIDILTLFPEMFPQILQTSILGRAQKAGVVEIRTHQLRDWATDAHKTVDDTPYGGGPGMVLKIDVIDRALDALKNPNVKLQITNKSQNSNEKPLVILLTPQGRPFNQQTAKELSERHHFILIAGHYEGFDERVRALVDLELSIGDYILTGGELPAMVVVDAVTRLLPGVLGNEHSSADESFTPITHNSLPITRLEYPHYTRPDRYDPISKPVGTLTVPDVLKSGNHAAINNWRADQATQKTRTRRPDLLES